MLLYDVNLIEQDVGFVAPVGVELRFQSRAVDLQVTAGAAKSVTLAGGERVGGDVFVDACGAPGRSPAAAATATGAPCASVAVPLLARGSASPSGAGRKEVKVLRKDGKPGFISGSCELEPQSLAGWLVRKMAGSGSGHSSAGNLVV